MTLREEAEKAARERLHYEDQSEDNRCVADAIERVAKAFALEALAHHDHNMCLLDFGRADALEHIKKTHAPMFEEAIAAAELGE